MCCCLKWRLKIKVKAGAESLLWTTNTKLGQMQNKQTIMTILSGIIKLHCSCSASQSLALVRTLDGSKNLSWQHAALHVFFCTVKNEWTITATSAGRCSCWLRCRWTTVPLNCFGWCRKDVVAKQPIFTFCSPFLAVPASIRQAAQEKNLTRSEASSRSCGVSYLYLVSSTVNK